MCLRFNKKFYFGLGIGVFITLFLLAGFLGYYLVGNFQEFQSLIQVISLIQTQALEPLDTGEIFVGAASGIVNMLKDPYSAYLSEKEYLELQQDLSGNYGGIGLLIGLDEEERLIVISPFKGTPAHRSGIRSGDRILKIDNRDTTGMKLETAANLMKGKPGTEVTLTIIRENEIENTLEFKLTREVIEIPSVQSFSLEGHPEIIYINLSMFSNNTAADLGEILDKEKGKGIILDLRNNPGGTLDTAVEVADYFLSQGPIVFIKSRQGIEEFVADKKKVDLPLVVLVNKGSASASEIVAGAVKDRKAGILVGETTFGKGLVQTVYEVGGGAAVKLTTAKYLTPLKKDIDKKGIKPDVEVPMPENNGYSLFSEPLSLDKDPQLGKAVEILEEQMDSAA